MRVIHTLMKKKNLMAVERTILCSISAQLLRTTRKMLKQSKGKIFAPEKGQIIR